MELDCHINSHSEISNMVAHMLAIFAMEMAVDHRSHLMILPIAKKWYEADLQASNPVRDSSTSANVQPSQS